MAQGFLKFRSSQRQRCCVYGGGRGRTPSNRGLLEKELNKEGHLKEVLSYLHFCWLILQQPPYRLASLLCSAHTLNVKEKGSDHLTFVQVSSVIDKFLESFNFLSLFSMDNHF